MYAGCTYNKIWEVNFNSIFFCIQNDQSYVWSLKGLLLGVKWPYKNVFLLLWPTVLRDC
jgi:hypothetical protein